MLPDLVLPASLLFLGFLASLLFLGVLVSLVIPADPRDHPFHPARLVLCKRKELLLQFNCRIFIVFKVDRIMDDPENSSCYVSGKAGLEKLEEKNVLSLSPFCLAQGVGVIYLFFYSSCNKS